MEKLAPLAAVDWAIIALFFAITLAIGLYFSRRATGSLTEYFVAGRKMTWWLAGTSIVATSFAADTPLVIAGWMRTTGLERNWFWWGGIMGMMLCTFFYARLWRRYHAMKTASLLREAMWSMVSEIHSVIDFDYVAYTTENMSRFERALVDFREL